MEETLQIKNENGMLTITCPVQEIVSLKKYLTDIFAEEVCKAFKEEVKDGYKFGVGKQLGEKFHCTSNNISTILARRGMKIERNITFE